MNKYYLFCFLFFVYGLHAMQEEEKKLTHHTQAVIALYRENPQLLERDVLSLDHLSLEEIPLFMQDSPELPSAKNSPLKHDAMLSPSAEAFVEETVEQILFTPSEQPTTINCRDLYRMQEYIQEVKDPQLLCTELPTHLTQEIEKKKKESKNFSYISPERVRCPKAGCNAYLNFSEVSTHLYAVHAVGSFFCENGACLKKFYSRKEKIEHMKYDHSMQCCSLCNQIFVKYELLKDHYEAVHNNGQYNCKICLKELDSEDAALQHCIIMHPDIFNEK